MGEVIVHLLNRVRPLVTSWTATRQASLSSTISQSLLRFMSIESMLLFQPSHPLLHPSPLAFHLFQRQGLFPMSWLFISGGQSTGASASASVLPTISFRNDWFDLHAVQGTLKSLLQHRCLKASVLQHTTSLMVQLSHLYMTIGKNTALTRWTFVGKVMSLLFNMLYRFVIAFLSRSKCLLIYGWSHHLQ